MNAAGIGSSSDSTGVASPSRSQEMEWYATMREDASPSAVPAVGWDPHMLHAQAGVEVPSLGHSVIQPDAMLGGDTCRPATTVVSLLRIFDILTNEACSPVRLPFQLDLLTIATCDASTLSHCLTACQVDSDAVFELGFGLWRTQHVTEEPEQLSAMTAVVKEGLTGKSTSYLIAFFRKALDDAGADKFHEAVLEYFKQLIPSSALAEYWKSLAVQNALTS